MAAEDPPSLLANVGISVGNEIVAPCFPRKYYRAAFMNVKIGQCCREQRSCFRFLSGFWHSEKKLIVGKIGSILRPRPIKQFGLRFVIDKTLVERKGKKAYDFGRVEADLAEVFPDLFGVVARD